MPSSPPVRRFGSRWFIAFCMGLLQNEDNQEIAPRERRVRAKSFADYCCEQFELMQREDAGE
jgi:hypothetical protein